MMQEHRIETVELDEERWRAWVLKGKLSDKKAMIRGRWIASLCSIAAVVAGAAFLMLRG